MRLLHTAGAGVRKMSRIIRGKRVARRDISQLAAHADARVKLVAEALSEALEQNCSAEELDWISRIESMRGRLAAQTDEIALTDFGAGSASDSRTAGEMAAGVQVMRTVGQCCRASKPAQWALLLFKLVRKLRPVGCLELGTCLGVSASYQAAALELNGNGQLVTLEGAEALAEMSRDNLGRLGLERCRVIAGRFQDTLPDVLEEISPLDYAFVDGHHDRDATLEYFAMLRPLLNDGALLVFDDIAWSNGMRQAWAEIRADEAVNVSVDLGALGLCLTGNGDERDAEPYRVRLPF